MASNTTVGPAGDNKGFDGVLRPDNYTPTDKEGGSEVDTGGDGNGLAGPTGEYDTYSNAGGGPASDQGFDPDHDYTQPKSEKEVSIDGTVGDHNRDNNNPNDGGNVASCS